MITRFELPRTEHYEAWLVWQFDAVLTTSAVDRDALARQAAAYRDGWPPIHVLPNGVDLDYFRPEPAIIRDPATLVLTGKMSYHANVAMARYFVTEVMPLVWAGRPDARVLIVGKDPDRQVRALARKPAVTVTGTVPDLRPYLRQATIAVAPIIYGAGIQNKVLEAMACATPVVATPLAVRALSAMPGRGLAVGHNTAELAGAILRLLDEPEQRAAMGAAARAYVEVNHNWATGTESLNNLYLSLTRRSMT
jgi:glycosyltransferase involved in cell wall biosynthesis